MAGHLTLHQRYDLPDDVIDVERYLLNVGLFRERPDATDHLARPVAVVYYPFHRAARRVKVGSSAVEPAQTGLGVGHDCIGLAQTGARSGAQTPYSYGIHSACGKH